MYGNSPQITPHTKSRPLTLTNVRSHPYWAMSPYTGERAASNIPLIPTFQGRNLRLVLGTVLKGTQLATVEGRIQSLGIPSCETLLFSPLGLISQFYQHKRSKANLTRLVYAEQLRSRKLQLIHS